MRGRCFAALGRVVEARAAHEAAIVVAEEFNLLLLQAMGLRDLLAVRGGSKQELEVRLGKVLGEMDGPAEMLQKVMGDGIAVASLIEAHCEI